MVSLDHQTPFEKPVAFVMLQVFQVVQSSVIVVSVTCVKSALVKTLTRRGVLRSRKISKNVFISQIVVLLTVPTKKSLLSGGVATVGRHLGDDPSHWGTF